MQRRLFLQTATGLFALPIAGGALAATATASQIELPPASELLVSYGLITDLHYARKPNSDTRKENGEFRNYTQSLYKLSQAVDLFNVRAVDFAIELGDFKDCRADGNREQTLEFLRRAEEGFARYIGPRYHVAGNHDFDLISYEDYLAETPNAGDANGKSYYSFVKNGVKFIVLDACYNNPQGEHYNLGNLDWTVAYIPKEELSWLQKELSSGSQPIIVMTHQLLNDWDAGKMAPKELFIKNAKEVVQLIESSKRVLAVLCGHWHHGGYSYHNGIHYVVCHAMVEQPLPHNSCAIVHVDRNQNIYFEGIYDQASHVMKKA